MIRTEDKQDVIVLAWKYFEYLGAPLHIFKQFARKCGYIVSSEWDKKNECPVFKSGECDAEN